MRWFQIITFPSTCITNKTKHQHIVKPPPRIQMGCSSGRNSHFELCLGPCFGLFSLNLLLPLQLQIVYFLVHILLANVFIKRSCHSNTSFLHKYSGRLLSRSYRIVWYPFFCLCSVNVLYTCIAMSVLWVHAHLCYFCVALLLSPGVFVLSVTGSHFSFSYLKATIFSSLRLCSAWYFARVFVSCAMFVINLSSASFAESLCCCSAVWREVVCLLLVLSLHYRLGYLSAVFPTLSPDTIREVTFLIDRFLTRSQRSLSCFLEV